MLLLLWLLLLILYFVLFIARKEGSGKVLVVDWGLLGLDLKRRSGVRRGIAVAHLLGHLMDRIGGRVNVHDGVQVNKAPLGVLWNGGFLRVSRQA
jgi:hypothetical protein